MQKHTKRQVKDISNNAFISDAYSRCLCVISDKTEMAKEKEYYHLTAERPEKSHYQTSAPTSRTCSRLQKAR